MNTKKPHFLLPLAVACLGLLGLSSQADARVHVSFGSGTHYTSGHQGHSYHGSRSTHGQRYVTKRVFAGYDCHRRPIYRYVRVPVSSSRCGTNTGYYQSGHYQRSSQSSRGHCRTGYRPSGYSHSYVRVR